ncbi:MAG: hypothetical protein LPK07_02590, partial [Hymenobacteraceae bacterium]|nr:hypothetical protein [Hymenobacteraceae bacterium]
GKEQHQRTGQGTHRKKSFFFHELSADYKWFGCTIIWKQVSRAHPIFYSQAAFSGFTVSAALTRLSVCYSKIGINYKI